MSKDTADRIHAWEAQQHSAASAPAEPAPSAEKPASSSAEPAKTAAKPASRSSASSADGSQPSRATAADFDKAAAERSAARTKARSKASSKATSKARPRAHAKPTPKSSKSKSSSPRSEADPKDAPTSDATPAPVKAAAPVKPPHVKLRYVHGHLVVPPPLRGSHEILVHQNVVADREGLSRIQDADDLQDMREKKLLVPIPAGHGLRVDPRLPRNRRYTRPWTATFLADLAKAHAVRFHSSLQVNSAVRTVDFQEHLISYNDNAAPAKGDTASPHLTGQAVDLAKHGLSRTEIAWLRAYLAPLIAAGKIDVEEEFQQACFHISVYRKYVPETPAPPRHLLAGAKPAHPRSKSRPTASIAAAIP